MKERLIQLAKNFWWTGDPWANDVFASLDPWLWEQLGHNPLAILEEGDLENAPKEWLKNAEALCDRFDRFLAKPKAENCPKIVYFCMEFGLHESFPMYSGGLGILAGDHIRSAADLKLDFCGIGLLYKHGYFYQEIVAGQQTACYPDYSRHQLPIEPVMDNNGKVLIIEIPFRNETLLARAWKLMIGEVPLYLLDTNVEGNSEEKKQLTASLYGGQTERRIAQEMLLGIGGARLLKALQITPDVHHMNEGHAAFLAIELWAQQLRQGVDAAAAWDNLQSKCVFTTHTPVPAGHDQFYWDLVNQYLGPYRQSLGLTPGSFMSLGREDIHDLDTPLSMTTLAMKSSCRINGVSKLHAEVSREMFPNRKDQIDSITNGVHPTAWLAPDLAELLDKRLPKWNSNWENPHFWKGVNSIPTSELWAVRAKLRARLIAEVRRRLGYDALDPNALTIGFARRFATYKRGDLIFTDKKRLKGIIDQGVQLLFAGKAHPADVPGQAIIQRVLEVSRDPDFRGKIVFIPNYDASIGRLLTQGCDVWLNNPRRPREASGTSGQKAALNGNLNLSILDGWWPEAFDGNNGWAIGDTKHWDDTAAQDEFDVESLYQLLEQDIIPAFQNPDIWCKKMAHAIVTCAPVFNTHRMVRDYLKNMYTLNG